ncbi:type III effector protein [Streptomyces angustmyceticus]|uniref:Type III effector protein n=1 Tax=Streptomyces mooreae TaxID=3075523 RepID=A0ABU2TJM3_9ACTN|nr:type III effector protein [Streptomyces sp. DSM 41527]MDT0461126.1 type III effector protein [Streptomyces sp. DSM 41527]
MPRPDQPTPSPSRHAAPVPFLAAAAALNTINEAMYTAHTAQADEPHAPAAAPQQALASLMLLREVREQLAAWETDLIEAAREAGASWADLAQPLGVASRQAAERRYLRLRPGPANTTGEARVKATRDRRAANRSVAAWARHNAADLRQLAGQITALTNLPANAHAPIEHLNQALADDDAANLLAPLAAAAPHLQHHPDLATRIKTLTHHAEQLRHHSNDQRRAT